MAHFLIDEVPRSKIIEMLKEEQFVRYSPQIQSIYTDQYYHSRNYPNAKRLNIELEVQKFILNKFGYTTNEVSIDNYHKIPSVYWNDEEVKNSIFYMKLNIFKYKSLNVGDDMIDCEIIKYETKEPIYLSTLTNGNKPLVILAGSMT